MRLFVLNGSPRPHGSTAQLCEALVKGSIESGATAIYACLGEKKLSFCHGCRECSRSGVCPQDDGISDLLGELVRCDALVMASPSYWRDVTAQMKTFIDRSTPLCEYVNRNTMAREERLFTGHSSRERQGRKPTSC